MSLLLFLAAVTGQAAQPTTIIQVQPKGGGSASQIRQEQDPLTGELEQAMKLIRTNDPYDSLPILDKLIAAEEARNRDEKRIIFSARSMMEAILYAGMGASQKKSAVVLDGTWSTAYFAKAFALIDLNRADEAKAYLDRAVALAPMNAQFLAERGEWYKNRKDWNAAFKDFESAASAANFSPDQVKSSEQRRAWRGMAYARTEEGKLDEARGLLRQCLKLEPNDEKCQHELDYVNGLKGKST